MKPGRREVLAAGLFAATRRASASAVPEGMVHVPAGKFTMGVGETEHTVHVDAFHIGRCLVTNAEYRAFVEAAGHRMLPRHWKGGAIPEGKANHPVLWVSWHDALRFCAWASTRAGIKLTLPTEAQWEKAARGPDAYTFPWGNDWSPDNLNCNAVWARKFGLAVGSRGEVRGWKEFTQAPQYRKLMETGGGTTPVNAYPGGRSHYGSYDMAGNAWEWCLDWYASAYHRRPDAGSNPAGPSREEADEVSRAAERGKVKVIRGGSWYAHLSSARSYYREETRSPAAGYHSVGFRVVAL